MQGERKRINFFFLRFQPCFQGRSSSYGGGKNRDHGDKPLNSPWYTSSSLPVTQSDYETRESRKQKDLLILRLAILGFKLNKKDCCLRSYRNILLLGRCTAFLLCFHIKSFVSWRIHKWRLIRKELILLYITWILSLIAAHFSLS